MHETKPQRVISGILFFKYGRRIGKSEEALLPDFLQTTLEARQEDSNENIAVASFPNESAVATLTPHNISA